MTEQISLPLGLASLRREAAADRKLPPVENWNPSHCGDSFMRIARDGTWYHHSAPIARHELVRLFSTVLRKDADGYYLVTPGEKLSIVVEDAPFLAVLLDLEGEGRDQLLRFTTNVGDEIVADSEHRICVEIDVDRKEPAPHLHVRHGLKARIARSVFYQLADLAVADAGGLLGVWSSGVFFPIGQPE